MNLLPKEIGSTVRSAFSRIDIAEQEIAALTLLQRADLPDNAFLMLVPPAIFTGLDDQLYRHHVRELLSRMRNRMDVHHGTDAELLAHLCAASLVRPPAARQNALIHHLWFAVFGATVDGGPLPAEEYPNAVNEDRCYQKKRIKIQRGIT